uniref:Uncharacterized protein n=1 Tax=Oryza rufipogon TaxID=4529 RepID=A0A0E0P8C6_ORYRU
MVEDWWHIISHSASCPRKTLKSLQRASMPAIIIAKIKEEARTWIAAGAAKLTKIIPTGE